uniref:Uncharacterized protein n=1 Tax=Haemonchus contortus TaxID=6289 RepID=A0A7I4YN57_HAECO
FTLASHFIDVDLNISKRRPYVRTFTMCPFVYAEPIQLPSLFACGPDTVGRKNVPEKMPFRRLRNNSL